MGRVGRNQDNLSVRTVKWGCAYLRASTGEQALSIQAQRDAIEKWAKLYKVEIKKWFVDEGVHGDTDPIERRGLRECLQFVGNRAVDYVVIALRDRFSRDTRIDGFCEYFINKSGAAIYSCDENPDEPDSPQRSLLRNILKSIAQYERELIGWRTREALGVLRKHGATLGRPPKHKAAEAAVLHYVIEYLRSYGLKAPAIYQYLAEQGFPKINEPTVTFFFERREKSTRVKRVSAHSFHAIRHWLRPYFRQYVWQTSPTPLASSSPVTKPGAMAPTASQL
jgi:DNA invertase Pin-like site-specific DNA recombinase